MPEMPPVARMLTPGIIAREIGKPLARVLYVLRTRSHIRATARAGTLRLYDRKAVAQVRHELNAIDARRAEREAARNELPAAPRSIPSKSPAELVAIAIAAHKAGDVDQQTAALLKLDEQFGYRLTFGMPPKECEADDGT